MDQPKDLTTPETRPSMPPGVRISVTDFGPIASGTVDLRPLTVFVGPSNTGKTYFAILIYALHRILGGFPRLPVRAWYGLGYSAQSDQPTADIVREEEIRDVIEKLDTEERPFRFSDLPKSVRDMVQTELNEQSSLRSLRSSLQLQLMRCFDLESVSDLVRSGDADGMKVLLNVNEEAQDLWRFHAETSKLDTSDIITKGAIEDSVLFPAERPASELRSSWAFRIRRLIKTEQELGSLLGGSLFQRFDNPRFPWSDDPFGTFTTLLSDLADSANRRTYYLPAARGGIMQSHSVIASSLVARSARAGLERLELPTFSGVIADFMERLILYEEGRRKTSLDSALAAAIARAVDRRDDKPNEQMKEIADALEHEVLTGQIRTREASPGAYPEFVYRALGATQDIRLSRASSMVSELAPVILFLRGAVERGDMLIIEEPEAHLHPAAQTRVAVALARLVRAGVRVVITTHSDWLLKEIGNLIREGELKKRTGETASEGDLPSSLHPSEVGIWLFRKDDDSAGSVVKEIPFDRSEGVEPPDYEDVAEELYNRSANLQNRLEEIVGDTERDDE